MATITHINLEVCDDCAQLIANDEATDEHRAAVAAAWQDVPGQLVLSGDEDTYVPFSSIRCDGCDSQLAGGRHTAARLV